MCSSVCSVQDLRTGGCRFAPRLKFFRTICDSHCDRIHSSLTAVHCFDDWLGGKAASSLERILCGVLVKYLQDSINGCTGRCDIIEIMLKRC